MKSLLCCNPLLSPTPFLQHLLIWVDEGESKQYSISVTHSLLCPLTVMRMSRWPKSLLNWGHRGKVKVNAKVWVLPARASAREENERRKGDGGLLGPRR